MTFHFEIKAVWVRTTQWACGLAELGRNLPSLGDVLDRLPPLFRGDSPAIPVDSSARSQTISVGFDGVIHHYGNGWEDGMIYDSPVQGAFDAIESLLDRGLSVCIQTSRDAEHVVDWLNARLDCPWTACLVPSWMSLWDTREVVGVTNRKLPAVVYIDAKALRFEGDWGVILDQLALIGLTSQPEPTGFIIDPKTD